MVAISLTDTFVQNDPNVVAAGSAYVLILGNDKNMIPSVSRSLGSIDNAITNGSPFQINLQPGCDFLIDDAIFQNLVNNATGGGNTEVINRILHYVNIGVIQVAQATPGQPEGTPMTAKQILTYTAP